MESYNPILRVELIVKRGFGAIRPRPTIHIAHVLYGPGREPLVLQHGSRLSRTESMFGRYTQAYYIDVSMQRLEWNTQLPCRGDAHNFLAWFGLTCWVIDPAVVVRENIRDAGAVLWSAVLSRARAISRNYYLGDTTEAESEINRQLGNVILHPAFATHPVQAHLSPDPQAVEIGRRSTDVTAWNSFVDNPLVAAYLAEHPGDINGALAVYRELVRQYEEGIEAYRAVGGRPLDQKDAQKELLDRQARRLGIQPQIDVPTQGVRPVPPPREPSVSADDEAEIEAEPSEPDPPES
jgi:hypothetical protein